MSSLVTVRVPPVVHCSISQRSSLLGDPLSLFTTSWGATKFRTPGLPIDVKSGLPFHVGILDSLTPPSSLHKSPLT